MVLPEPELRLYPLVRLAHHAGEQVDEGAAHRRATVEARRRPVEIVLSVQEVLNQLAAALGDVAEDRRRSVRRLHSSFQLDVLGHLSSPSSAATEAFAPHRRARAVRALSLTAGGVSGSTPSGRRQRAVSRSHHPANRALAAADLAAAMRLGLVAREHPPGMPEAVTASVCLYAKKKPRATRSGPGVTGAPGEARGDSAGANRRAGGERLQLGGPQLPERQGQQTPPGGGGGGPGGPGPK